MNLSARLKNAIIRIAGLCPFYNNPWNIYDREKFHLINNAINELNVAFADHADDVERKAIGIFRAFQDEEIDELLSVNEFQQGYNVEKLKRKYRKMEDHLHGFIYRNTKDKLQLDNKTFASILASQRTDTAAYRLEGYIKNLIERNIPKMAVYLGNRLPKQIEDINSEFLQKNYWFAENKEQISDAKKKCSKYKRMRAYQQGKRERIILSMYAGQAMIDAWFYYRDRV